jgi:hypothetical protein
MNPGKNNSYCFYRPRNRRPICINQDTGQVRAVFRGPKGVFAVTVPLRHSRNAAVDRLIRVIQNLKLPQTTVSFVRPTPR